MPVSHTPVNEPTPLNAFAILAQLPQRVSTLLKHYEASQVSDFEDFERQLHVLFAQTECAVTGEALTLPCLLYTSPSPRDRQKSRMPSSA